VRSVRASGPTAFTHGEDYEATAVLWMDGEIYELNDLVVIDEGWDLQDAFAINESGVIVGVGVRDGTLAAPRAFMLVPDDDGAGATAGDANGDCAVDASDLLIVLADYGQSGEGQSGEGQSGEGQSGEGPGGGLSWEHGDFDGDGDVDALDLLVVLEAFGTGCDG